jgi:hypothetical protein
MNLDEANEWADSVNQSPKEMKMNLADSIRFNILHGRH